MSDTLVNRLRGIYEVGHNAEFGTRSFADALPPIAFEAADEIDSLQAKLTEAEAREEVLRYALSYLMESWVEGIGSTHNRIEALEEAKQALTKDKP